MINAGDGFFPISLFDQRYLKLDQSTPEALVGLADGFLKLTGGVLGTGAGGGAPAAPDGAIQYNHNGAFAGSDKATLDENGAASFASGQAIINPDGTAQFANGTIWLGSQDGNAPSTYISSDGSLSLARGISFGGSLTTPILMTD